jgi:hypothetical protein
MKLINFKNYKNYIFDFTFENSTINKIDISTLIKNKVTLQELKTAHIDKDWGCLEFNNGMIDIEPKTLYNFCFKNNVESVN